MMIWFGNGCEENDFANEETWKKKRKEKWIDYYTFLYDFADSYIGEIRYPIFTYV